MTLFRKRVQRHKKLAWASTVFFIAFMGCFAFPFSNELFPLSIYKVVTILVGYGIIGMCFAGLLEKGKGATVFAVTAAFTIIGLICRYLLEYGEVSNTMNFIPQSIITYLAIVPIYCTTAYWGIYRLETMNGEK